jgi:hypothetical protein
MNIPPDLYQRLYDTLLRCGPFGSDSELRAIFADVTRDPPPVSSPSPSTTA